MTKSPTSRAAERDWCAPPTRRIRCATSYATRTESGCSQDRLVTLCWQGPRSRTRTRRTTDMASDQNLCQFNVQHGRCPETRYRSTATLRRLLVASAGKQKRRIASRGPLTASASSPRLPASTRQRQALLCHRSHVPRCKRQDKDWQDRYTPEIMPSKALLGGRSAREERSERPPSESAQGRTAVLRPIRGR